MNAEFTKSNFFLFVSRWFFSFAVFNAFIVFRLCSVCLLCLLCLLGVCVYDVRVWQAGKKLFFLQLKINKLYCVCAKLVVCFFVAMRSRRLIAQISLWEEKRKTENRRTVHSISPQSKQLIVCIWRAGGADDGWCPMQLCIHQPKFNMRTNWLNFIGE